MLNIKVHDITMSTIVGKRLSGEGLFFLNKQTAMQRFGKLHLNKPQNVFWSYDKVKDPGLFTCVL